jgi:Raf kinase inhibitor-like YbhB/YbcL family protein
MKRILFVFGFLLFFHSSLAFTLSSPKFEQNGPIPRKYTCQGENISPPLRWKNPPMKTQSYLLVMADQDTQRTHGFILIHWVLYDIHHNLRYLGENTIEGTTGLNGKNNVAYEGPCPPPGMGPHHYVFRLYALDVPVLELPRGAMLEDVDEVSKGHIIGTAQLVGTYQHQ